MDEIKQRNVYWDNIKGFLMLLTVFAHILYQLQGSSEIINSIVDYIYMFHMPAFVFVCGYFGKSEHSRSFEAIIKLIFLYFIFNSLMGFIYGFSSLLQPMYSYWFLIALIAWRLTAHHIAKFREINLILFAVALFSGFFDSIDNTFAAARIIGFYPFYMSGYLLSEEKSRTLEGTKYYKRFMPGAAALSGAALIAFAANNFLSLSDSDMQMGAYSDPSGAFGRIVLYIIAFLAIYALRNISPCRKIPLITMFGRNSLWIFLLHRPLTLLISGYIQNLNSGLIIIISFIAAIIICVLFGNDMLCKYTNKFAAEGAAIFTGKGSKKISLAKISSILVALGFIAAVVIDSYSGVTLEDIKKIISGEAADVSVSTSENTESDIFYPIMTAQQKADFDNAFRITFAGDLILLEDQVKRGYNGTDYDFSDMFEYTEKYIASADYAIGVFEGPMAGEASGYSSSNFDDGKELHLNYPDSFGQAVKNAGFDLVTTANNHLFDKGFEGLSRTLDVLDSIGLDHTGSYRSAAEKQSDRIKLVECSGIRMAVLSYTYGCNYVDNLQLTDGDLSFITSIISGTSGEQFEKLKAQVEQDFSEAKALEPDIIIVLPHIGTQFSNQPDREQQVWFDIFKQNGADIILGDHPHVVEPAVIEEYNGRNVFTAYCPGNFANIYRENQGDTSMLVDVYISRATNQVIGGSIVPLYTQSAIEGNYRALPIYDITHDSSLRKQLSTDDLARAEIANNIISDVVFGHKMDISSVTERYYFDSSGFIRSKADGLELTDEMKSGKLFKAMQKADSICFIGDSVTEGTKNGGCPWYEPIEEYFTDKTINNCSKGGCTVSYMTDNIESIPQADLYVIALGTNDVRYRDESICAMTAEDYVSKLDMLKAMLSQKSANAEFIFIAPWYSTDGDPFCNMSYSGKTAMNEEYSSALEAYCRTQNTDYINPNGYIRQKLTITPDSYYLLDHIHPNCSSGVVMYSEAVLLN